MTLALFKTVMGIPFHPVSENVTRSICSDPNRRRYLHILYSRYFCLSHISLHYILYQGLKAPVTGIITVVTAFLVICAGITILQMSKDNPTTLSTLDRKSTILLAANRTTQDAQKGDVSAIEDPGVDAIRGSLDAIGSIVRARSARKMSLLSAGTIRSRRAAHGHAREDSTSTIGTPKAGPSLSGMKWHQLFDNPVPPLPEDATERISMYPNVASPRHMQSPKKARRSSLESRTLRDTSIPIQTPNRTDSRSHLGTSAPAGIASRPLDDDPYLPRSAAPGFNSYQLHQDSISSFTEHDHSRDSVVTITTDGADSPPRVAGGQGRFQRSYPQDREMDREESMSLVGGARGMDLEGESEHGRSQSGITNGRIRLVPSLHRRQFCFSHCIVSLFTSRDELVKSNVLCGITHKY
ncbi:hypothetical protein FRC09_013283 [Ceratobasidium sp. 395]|nr:hypothetical protein FRC09_013283 [Ceratobasidium sp. 395]